MRRFLLGISLLSLLLSACDSPFPPRNLVERLRPLAVKASPPECGLSDQVELEALVADPQGQGRTLSFNWALCIVELDSAASDIACPGPDSYPLPGQGASSSLSMPELLDWLMEKGYDLDPEQWPEGEEMPEDISLFVGFEVSAGEEMMRGVKRIKLRLDGTSGDNENPRLEGLEMDGVAVEDAVLQIPAGAQVVMAPLVDESSRDTYIPDGESETQVEDFVFSWFCSAGEFEEDKTILDTDSEGRRLDTNVFKAPLEPGPVTVWLVVRDARFGTDWMSWQVEILE